MTDFYTWSQENLAKFATEANAKMAEQHDRIQQLQCELKDAIEAYRAVLRTSEGRPLGEPSPSQTSASSVVTSETLIAGPGNVVVTHQELDQLMQPASGGR